MACLGQDAVLRFWPELDDSEKESLLEQLAQLDDEFLSGIRERIWPLAEQHPANLDGLTPLEHIPLPRSESERNIWAHARERGEALLAEGAVAALVVAGGQGTRLGYPGPKGMFPIGPISGRSLFQYHIEKILVLEKRYGRPLPFYVMTSPGNHQETMDYFAENCYFGKDPESVVFFPQRMLPVFDVRGQLLLETNHALSLSPDGHGGLLYALRKHRILADMHRRGTKQLYYFQVDNVLAQIADPVFLGFHDLGAAEMSAKTVCKRDPSEKLGNIGRLDGVCKVIEYTELPEEKKRAISKEGALVFGQGSIGIHLFSVDFLERLAQHNVELPYHIALKKMISVEDQSPAQAPGGLNAVKFEQFIFDAFAFADRIEVLETERRQEFSPIKNKEGEDSPAAARRDLCELFAKWLEQCGLPPPRHPDGALAVRVEISPLIATSAGELAQKVPAGLDLNKDILLEKRAYK
jgi:UDP-N-acetylglucosamine/UDP-N-acetylgalactosamine diphosphorylase